MVGYSFHCLLVLHACNAVLQCLLYCWYRKWSGVREPKKRLEFEKCMDRKCDIYSKWDLYNDLQKFPPPTWYVNQRNVQVVNVVVVLPVRNVTHMTRQQVACLDSKSPTDFQVSVLYELGDLPRKHLLLYEHYRRKTFEANWIHESDRTLNGIAMAKAGFFRNVIDNMDTVECAFCQRKNSNWTARDDPIEVHLQLSPKCRFACGLPSGDVPYDQVDQPIDFNSQLKYVDLRSITQYGSNAFTSSDFDEPVNNVHRISFGIRTFHVLTERDGRQYAFESERLETYRIGKWPRKKPSKQLLCKAGFYFTGVNDLVCCFCCSIGIWRWGAGDDPWQVHAQINPHCSFLANNR